MMFRVDWQPEYQISYIFKGVTPPLLANYLYLNFLKYETNGVVVFIMH